MGHSEKRTPPGYVTVWEVLWFLRYYYHLRLHTEVIVVSV